MNANKDKNYQIKENEAGNYHILFIRHEKPKFSMKTIEKHHVAQFSVRDYKALLRTIDNVGIFVTGWHEMKIVHDPTLPVKCKVPDDNVQEGNEHADEKASTPPKRKAKV